MSTLDQIKPTVAAQLPITFAIACGIVGSAATLTAHLERQGFVACDSAAVTLVLDLPLGFALHVLSQRPAAAHPLVVRTWNASPAYIADLWDCRPSAILVDDNLDIGAALVRAAPGKRDSYPPVPLPPLTRRQRQMLRLIAYGYDNEQIAQLLEIQTRTVLNAVSQILAALQLASRSQAAVYYWGIKRSDSMSILALGRKSK